ncbi:hypothetical protein [Amycolatopsis sp. FDAARGOS 1241]|uniref:hypothetical protein n=1 Tax=Amycolatopsis sp. FDAARGOS 1241 TaxID=2778070 RepID=UPI0019512C38|nr:hypothetical protein [Amycolatopsis sp. FDAARGOS 1241]QRP44790.1 hypothetical protein I6J71_37070 [Amycolatopsis sp. FDAARGOS 1241]
MTHDETRAGSYPGAVEIGNMYQFYADAADSFIESRDLERVRRLNPRLKPLEEWLQEHKSEIPLD